MTNKLSAFAITATVNGQLAQSIDASNPIILYVISRRVICWFVVGHTADYIRFKNSEIHVQLHDFPRQNSAVCGVRLTA
jgi:hypothetical protein